MLPLSQSTTVDRNLVMVCHKTLYNQNRRIDCSSHEHPGIRKRITLSSATGQQSFLSQVGSVAAEATAEALIQAATQDREHALDSTVSQTTYNVHVYIYNVYKYILC